MLTLLYRLSGGFLCYLEDAWHLPESRAFKENLGQAEVGHNPALRTMLPPSIQKLHRVPMWSGLFGITIWNSLVIAY